MKHTVYTGIARIATVDALLKGKRLGLITNPTGLNRDLVSTADVLNDNNILAAMCAPEHGVRGDAQAGDAVASYTDEKTFLCCNAVGAQQLIDSYIAADLGPVKSNGILERVVIKCFLITGWLQRICRNTE